MSTPENLKRAAVTPCQECPWRVSNVHRPAPAPYEDSYTDEHMAGLWRALIDGEVQGCHLTGTPETFPHGFDSAWIEAGYQALPGDVDPKECAGSVAAALRELRSLVEAGSYEEYVKRRPNGLTRPAAAMWVARVQGASDLPEVRQPRIADANLVDSHDLEPTDPLALIPTESLVSFRQSLDAILDGCQAEGDA